MLCAVKTSRKRPGFASIQGENLFIAATPLPDNENAVRVLAWAGAVNRSEVFRSDDLVLVPAHNYRGSDPAIGALNGAIRHRIGAHAH